MSRDEIVRLGISVFCILQMALVAIFGVLESLHTTSVETVSTAVTPLLTPLREGLFIKTQDWSIFTGLTEPVRNAVVEKKEGNEWTAVVHIRPETLTWRERQPELKQLRNLLRHEGDDRQELLQSYVHMICRREGIAPDTFVRFVQRSTTNDVLLETPCPSQP